MNLVEEITLSNNLIMQVWDGSRAIASDTTKVELRIVIDIAVRKEYFNDPEHLQQVAAVFGPEISYEYTKERTFVDTTNREMVFNELLEDFRKDSLPYISRTDFPARFAMSKLRDIRQHPYRYHDIPEKQASER